MFGEIDFVAVVGVDDWLEDDDNDRKEEEEEDCGGEILTYRCVPITNAITPPHNNNNGMR